MDTQQNLSNALTSDGTTDPQMLIQMQKSADSASQLLKSLSHPDRLMLLCHLTQGEYCVKELESISGITQPTLSQQLGVLRKDGIIKLRREGKQNFYSINNADALAVLDVLYQRFCQIDIKG